MLAELKEQMETMRHELNHGKYANDVTVRYMTVERMKLLDDWLYEYCQQDTYLSKKKDFSLEHYYDMLENNNYD